MTGHLEEKTTSENTESRYYSPDRIIRSVVILLSSAAVLYLIWYFKIIISYILASVVLSLVGKPVSQALERIRFLGRRMPDWMSALITLTGLWTVIGLLLYLIVPVIAGQAKRFSELETGAVLQALQVPIDQLVDWLARHNIHFHERQSLEDYVHQKVGDAFELKAFTGFFGTIFSLAGDLFIAFFSISFITFFFLRDNSLFYRGLLTLTPTRYENKIKNIIVDSRRLLSRYFIGIGIQILLITICITLGSLLVGLSFQMALTMGFVAGIVNIIPYVGPLIAFFFSCLLFISENLGADFYAVTVPGILKILGVFIVTKSLDDFVFQPGIFSKSVKAHPLELFLVILIAGDVGGILGMILAIPSYTFIRIIARQFFSNFKVVQRLTRNL
ncbi:MAG: AI-2E family transporter [Flavobacteriales bacterium]|nr:AI-2E family transporter [Flavobacteriales bacterium]MCX7649900.1 AI-2E family transporter [Flavobacteriales bacterium]MDW8432959.1 AI-2E family transporter [Flavobacteriales bacterium]